MILKSSSRIGLDIDDVLSDFYSAYCEYFDTDNNPKMLIDNIITRNVHRILRNDRNFWLNLKVKQMPNFIPELFCTKRINNKAWTKKWLQMNGFPNSPVYQMYLQSGNKARMIKGRVDVFIDDSISNMIKMNLSGVPCLLMDTPNNKDWGPIGRIYTLDKDEIMEIYELFMKTVFPNFKNLV